MRNRINLFAMYVTCIGLLVTTGPDAARLEEVYAQLPGGREAMPGFTRAVLGPLGWLSTWWPLCVLLGAGVAFGAPAMLRRTPAGERFLNTAGRWLSEYHGTVVVLFVAAMFNISRAVELALFLPWLRMVEQLTGG